MRFDVEAMSVKHLWTITILMLGAAVLIFAAESQACEYSVRDAAFVMFPGEEYKLFIYVDSAGDGERIGAICRPLFLESTVVCEVVDVELQERHPALRHLPVDHGGGYPLAVLVPPDSEREPLKLEPLMMPLAGPASAGDDSLRGALRPVIHSTARGEIVRHTVESLGVVLLIEGRDDELNHRARAAAAEAIGRVARMMPAFPKPIHAPALLEEPPRVVPVSEQAYDDESVLRWSLGLAGPAPAGPRAVVLHGRGRRIGPLLEGADLNAHNLAGVLSIIGQDCECDLPRSWLQGELIPLEWNSATRSKLAGHAGFDADSPMVRSEVGWMVRGREPEADADDATLDPLFGYSEFEVVLEEDGEGDASGTAVGAAGGKAAGAADPAGDPTGDPTGATCAPQPPTPAPVRSGETEEPSMFRTLLPVIGVLALLVLAWGALVMVRTRRRSA